MGALPKLPEGMYSNFPVPTASDAINVVLLDSLNTPLADQAMVRREMISYLKSAPTPRMVRMHASRSTESKSPSPGFM